MYKLSQWEERKDDIIICALTIRIEYLTASADCPCPVDHVLLVH